MAKTLDDICGYFDQKIRPEEKTVYLTPDKTRTTYENESWIIGFGSYEDKLMSSKPESYKCLKLLSIESSTRNFTCGVII